MAVLARVDGIEASLLASGLERKTGWSLAEYVGEKSPDGMQRQYTGTAGRITNCQLGAWLAFTRAALADDNSELPTSTNEICRMFIALCGPARDEKHTRRWSQSRHSQQRARHCHYQRQREPDH